jgi:D-tyrosyl-tRNA(Tyr) deacylase
MRFVIQRVKHARVSIHQEIAGAIEKGLLVFVGISEQDTEKIADKMVKKLVGLRIFEDESGKTNLDLKTVNGNLLIISQFTLYADCKKGNRPSFIQAGSPEKAKRLYDYILDQCRKHFPDTQQGEFGADMQISLTNDGPFTILLDSDEIC